MFMGSRKRLLFPKVLHGYFGLVYFLFPHTYLQWHLVDPPLPICHPIAPFHIREVCLDRPIAQVIRLPNVVTAFAVQDDLAFCLRGESRPRLRVA